MSRYKWADMSPRLLPVDLREQLVLSSFSRARHHLVYKLDLLACDTHRRTAHCAFKSCASRRPRPHERSPSSSARPASLTLKRMRAHRLRRRSRTIRSALHHRRTHVRQLAPQQATQPLHIARAEESRRPVESVRACPQHRKVGEVPKGGMKRSEKSARIASLWACAPSRGVKT